ncbi:hypothetical protein [Planococcus halotolerans]|uniref:hypothetical protein n=1 Tax=Planococcus halotolerans TaxID=2233542 RepID=UPI001366DE53|nr:hypothetical protein [Planococcus halotolerans]QHJ71633.1 hypothetical protein DNR44_013785 [Planococcus halotolerans]
MGKTNTIKLKGYTVPEKVNPENVHSIKETLAEMAIYYLRNREEIENQKERQ